MSGYACRGRCCMNHPDAILRPLGHWHRKGYRKCSNCLVAWETTRVTCPCCNTRLKTKTKCKSTKINTNRNIAVTRNILPPLTIPTNHAR